MTWIPPKTHNLIFLLNASGLKPDAEKSRIIARLNEANIATRYPDDVEKLQSNYTREITVQIMTQAEDVLKWIKQQF
jgi:HEPN domain-containing protein